MSDSFTSLQRDIHDCLLVDRPRLTRALQRLRTQQNDAAALEGLRADVAASQARVTARRAHLPRPKFDQDLPILARKDDIVAAIAQHQVVIVCGETGSGKTTQLPQLCLSLGRGVQGMIGCTQPRRIAARSVAARLAQELGTTVGDVVGCQVRFSDRVSPASYVKVMTDGILLAETYGDRRLNRYDTLIIDEAHERSLNIDFLLGYVQRLLRERPEFKLIITSATLDAERFSQHFGGAPVIEVTGRVYPVEVRYREYQSDDPAEAVNDLRTAVLHAVDELCAIARYGDVLVFLPGEREIRECAEALRRHHPPGVEILPLYARLSLAEQERVFRSGGARRIVLATNVAETSLTVPGIRYVVDSGLARINRYSPRRKISQLRVEKIARAAATQRAGRCGRLADGVCIRLYSEDDFNARAPFTTPELLRSSLASVILRMQALELGDAGQFPFVEPPSPRMIEAGYQLLAELGAVDRARKLTAIGRELAKLPLDPRIGRMLLAAREHNCVTELLVIGAVLAVQDPRERPAAARAAAVERHAQWNDERSDFLSYLKLWAFFEDALKHKKSNRKLAQLCADNFLSIVRLKEWRDVHTQLHVLAAEMGMRLNATPATYEQVHRALITGLLGNIGQKDAEEDNYRGARDSRFLLSNDSALAKKKPRWVVAAELMETHRVYARCVAGVEPQWIEAAASELVKRNYFDPHWERKAGQVAAYEKVLLYGLPIVAKRRVHYGPIDPVKSREIFIREALVTGELESRAPFLRHNLDLIESIKRVEQKQRRQDILVDDEALFAFYAARVPDGVHNAATFDTWRRDAEARAAQVLFMSRADVVRGAASWSSEAWYPDELAFGLANYSLEYHFNPGHPLDGVTVTLPLHALNSVSPARFDWLVPGLLRDRVTLLIRSLPQRLRRLFVPVKDTVSDALEALDAGATTTEPLSAALARFLSRRAGQTIDSADFDPGSLPPHLSMNFRVVDATGAELAMGRDLSALRAQFVEAAQAALRETPHAAERRDIRAWDFGDLPLQEEIQRGAQRIVAYPALVDRGDSAAIELFDSARAAYGAHRDGIVRLLLIQLNDQLRYLERNLPRLNAMSLRYAALQDHQSADPQRSQLLDVKRSSAELRNDLLHGAVERAFLQNGSLPRTEAEFAACAQAGRAGFVGAAQQLTQQVDEILDAHAQLRDRLKGRDVEHWVHAVDDIDQQLRHLVFPGFVRTTSAAALAALPRYLQAIQLRLDKLRRAPERDEMQTVEVQRLWQNYRQQMKTRSDDDIAALALEEVRWMIEELRVSLFAQELKTAYPVSIKRAVKQLQTLGRQLAA